MKNFCPARTHTDALLSRVIEKTGITRDSDLAHLLNIGKSQLSNYRKGRSNLGTLTLLRCWAIDGESWAIHALIELRKHDPSSDTEQRSVNIAPPGGYDRRQIPPEGYAMTKDDEKEWSKRALMALNIKGNIYANK